MAGKRLFVTGGTGFLGTALIERFLHDVPSCELVLLIRPGRRSTSARRAQREVFRNDAFDRLRAELSGSEFDEMIARRVSVVDGDVGVDGLALDEAGRAALASCDAVVHSAAAVSFDSPLDAAIEINLLGPSRIAATLIDLGVSPHFVSVSTCYVAGNHRGSAPERLVQESPYFVDVDWRAEVDGARRARSDAEAESRKPAQLEQFAKEARTELGAAGGPLLAAKNEQLRSRWVASRLVEAGRARASSLGWPDAYAYTKALAERALGETHGSIPVSIVRPSIIESALAFPKPGWIRGFRMAEPIIISYARGMLREFPGVPEGIIDVIPVDMVAATICAVLADEALAPRPDPTSPPRIVQVASGSRNPLRYRQLVELASDWFHRHPLYDRTGQPIMVPEWSFPARGSVQTQLQRSVKLLNQAEKAVNALPLRGRRAELSADLEEKRELAERAAGYVELYGAYAECEAVYGIDQLLELWSDLTDDDRDRFPFDPALIDWDSYVTKVHLPSVIQQARVRTTPGVRVGPTRSDRLRGQVLSPDRHMAAFDLENTLIASNVVESYSWLATRRLAPRDRLRFAMRTAFEGPSLLALDRRDRSDFLRYFYRRYEDAPVAQIHEDVEELFSDLVLRKSFPAAIRRVRDHRRLGHRTVLITGALDFMVKPLEPLFDDIVCARMSERDGRLTGELTAAPPTGEARAQAMADYADAEGLQLSESVAYADSTSDLPMLEAVGFPVAVNPETRLAAVARKRGWLVENFIRAEGAPKHLLPMGPEHRRVVSRARS